MPRWAVVYLLLAAAFLFFLSISKAPNAPHHRKNRRLFHVGFDPYLNQLERKAEQNGLFDPKSFQQELNKFWAGQDLHNFDGELGILESRINVTERIMDLFPLLDLSPKDGAISFDELEIWMHKQADDRLEFETEREIERHDKDGDGEITLNEYLNYQPNQEIDWSNMERDKAGWWRAKFRIADSDGNGYLNPTEFNHFLHPEDSRNPKMLLWLLKEKIRDMDRDKDGKLNLDEFRVEVHKIHGFFEHSETGNYRHPLDDGTNTQQKFQELDTNKDNFLTAEELMPIVQHLYPSGELAYATLQTRQLIQEADDDHDGKLTLKEMLHHSNAFYSTVFDEEDYADDLDGDDDFFDDYHYELRK